MKGQRSFAAEVSSTWSSMEDCSLLSFSKSSLASRRREEMMKTITNSPSFLQGCLPLLFSAKLRLPQVWPSFSWCHAVTRDAQVHWREKSILWPHPHWHWPALDRLYPHPTAKVIIRSLEVTAVCLILLYIAIVPLGFKLSSKEPALYFLCSPSVSALHTDGGLPRSYLLVRQLFH